MRRLQRPRPRVEGGRPFTAADIFRNLPTIRRAIQRAGIRGGDVDDVAADVIGAAWEGLHGFRGFPGRPEDSFRAWLSVIAWRTAGERRRRNKKETALVFESLVVELVAGHEDQIVARLTLQKLRLLSPKMRGIAEALAVAGSLTDAAELLGVPVGTACTRVRKLRRLPCR